MRSLWDAIDEIREKPEGIRRRYMLGYVSLTMVLVVGIWLISVQESFRSAGMTESAEDMKNQAGQILPSSSGTKSLSELFENGEALDAGNTSVPTEDFFENEVRAKDQGGVSGTKALDGGQ
jgi:hypothetical protein